MDFGSDSGDAFGSGEGSRRHLYSTGRMSSFALSLRIIKLRPFNICYVTLPKQDLVKALLYLPSSPPIQEESKRANALESN